MLALGAALFAYGPALTGPFVYDDTVQRYASPPHAAQSLSYWIEGLRPMLCFSFWLNHLISGDRPFGYHLGNVLIHVLNAALVFLVTHKLLTLYRNSALPWKLDLLAGFTAAVFLLHPLQTESVAYIASRSETLCAFFMLAALTLFLYRSPGPITWPAAARIVLLCGAAFATKEQGVILAPVLLLADLYWNVDFSIARLRRNWRLYLCLGIAGLIAGLAVLKIIGQSLSAGFKLHEFTWIEYLLTECRVFFTYIRLLILPVGQSIGPDVPVSRNIFDHGSIFGLIGIVILLGAAIYFRRRYRLASFGILLFVILLAPTSSFIPLLDPQVEHRLYLSVLALTLVAIEFLLRARIEQRQLAAICIAVSCAAGAMTFSRNHVWGDEILLWRDALSKAPNTLPPYYNVTIAYINQRRCSEAESFLETVPARFDRDVPLLTLWGRAEECLNKFDDAVKMLSEAAEITPRASIYIRIGLLRNRQGKEQEAYDAFERAIELDPSSWRAYVLRGQWHQNAGQFYPAVSDFRKALQLHPDNPMLRTHLDEIEQRLRFDRPAPSASLDPSADEADRVAP